MAYYPGIEFLCHHSQKQETRPMEPKTSDTTGTDEAPPQAAAPAKKISAWDKMMLEREETRDAKRDKKGNLPAMRALTSHRPIT